MNGNQLRTIQTHFSGGSDFDNDIAISGLTFDEALSVVELVGNMLKTRRAERGAALAAAIEAAAAAEPTAGDESPHD